MRKIISILLTAIIIITSSLTTYSLNYNIMTTTIKNFEELKTLNLLERANYVKYIIDENSNEYYEKYQLKASIRVNNNLYNKGEIVYLDNKGNLVENHDNIQRLYIIDYFITNREKYEKQVKEYPKHIEEIEKLIRNHKIAKKFFSTSGALVIGIITGGITITATKSSTAVSLVDTAVKELAKKAATDVTKAAVKERVEQFVYDLADGKALLLYTINNDLTTGCQYYGEAEKHLKRLPTDKNKYYYHQILQILELIDKGNKYYYPAILAINETELKEIINNSTIFHALKTVIFDGIAESAIQSLELGKVASNKLKKEVITLLEKDGYRNFNIIASKLLENNPALEAYEEEKSIERYSDLKSIKNASELKKIIALVNNLLGVRKEIGKINNFENQYPVVSFLGLGKKEVIQILGEPDREDWWEGAIIIYDEIKNKRSKNNQILKNECLVLRVYEDDYGTVMGLIVEEILGVKYGMNFPEAMEVLGKKLKVGYDESGYFGDYYISYSIEGYEITFGSWTSPNGPIEVIEVKNR